VGLPGLAALQRCCSLGVTAPRPAGLDDVLSELDNPQGSGEGLPPGQDPNARLADAR
jgi:hypothetical protein